MIHQSWFFFSKYKKYRIYYVYCRKKGGHKKGFRVDLEGMEMQFLTSQTFFLANLSSVARAEAAAPTPPNSTLTSRERERKTHTITTTLESNIKQSNLIRNSCFFGLKQKIKAVNSTYYTICWDINTYNQHFNFSNINSSQIRNQK